MIKKNSLYEIFVFEFVKTFNKSTTFEFFAVFFAFTTIYSVVYLLNEQKKRLKRIFDIDQKLKTDNNFLLKRSLYFKPRKRNSFSWILDDILIHQYYYYLFYASILFLLFFLTRNN